MRTRRSSTAPSITATSGPRLLFLTTLSSSTAPPSLAPVNSSGVAACVKLKPTMCIGPWMARPYPPLPSVECATRPVIDTFTRPCAHVPEHSDPLNCCAKFTPIMITRSVAVHEPACTLYVPWST